MELGVPRRADTGARDGLRAVAAIDAFDRLAGEKRDGLILEHGVADDVGCAVGIASILPEPNAAVFALCCWQGQGEKQRRSQQGFEHADRIIQSPKESTRKSSGQSVVVMVNKLRGRDGYKESGFGREGGLQARLT